MAHVLNPSQAELVQVPPSFRTAVHQGAKYRSGGQASTVLVGDTIRFCLSFPTPGDAIPVSRDDVMSAPLSEGSVDCTGVTGEERWWKLMG